MIKPINRGGEYLEFECECGEIFHDAKEIAHDAPTENDAQRYDVRNWTIMRIDLECSKCGKKDSLKLRL
jgi:hypothetical protein